MGMWYETEMVCVLGLRLTIIICQYYSGQKMGVKTISKLGWEIDLEKNHYYESC